jgi:curved DNA-binding protein CbpA
MRSTHYTILEVSPTAELDAIYIAHHAAQAALHHDVIMGNPEAQSQLRLIDLAYETLADPGKRAAYDTSLAAEQTQIMSVVEVEAVPTHPYLRVLLLALLLSVLGFFWQEKAAERQARAVAAAATEKRENASPPAATPEVAAPGDTSPAAGKPPVPKPK